MFRINAYSSDIDISEYPIGFAISCIDGDFIVSRQGLLKFLEYNESGEAVYEYEGEPIDGYVARERGLF